MPPQAKRPFFILSLARSGSTPVCNAIGAALQLQNCQYLSEYFNSNSQQPKMIDRRISFDADRIDKKQNAAITELGPLHWEELALFRIECLRKASAPAFFKLMIYELTDLIFDELCTDYDYYILKRRDQYQHFLSYLISHATDRWYEPGGLRIPDKSVLASTRLANRFFTQIQQVDELATGPSYKGTLYFEDFLKSGPEKFLKSKFGIRVPPGFDFMQPDRQNPENKEPLIQNLMEMRDFYSKQSRRLKKL